MDKEQKHGNDAGDQRRENADRERIGLLKHISVVSLAAMAFIGGGIVQDPSWVLKAAALCFLVAAFSSMTALVLNVANFPRGSSRRLPNDESVVNRVAFILAIVSVLLGILLVGLLLVARILLS